MLVSNPAGKTGFGSLDKRWWDLEPCAKEERVLLESIWSNTPAGNKFWFPEGAAKEIVKFVWTGDSLTPIFALVMLKLASWDNPADTRPRFVKDLLPISAWAGNITSCFIWWWDLIGSALWGGSKYLGPFSSAHSMNCFNFMLWMLSPLTRLPTEEDLVSSTPFSEIPNLLGLPTLVWIEKTNTYKYFSL